MKNVLFSILFLVFYITSFSQTGSIYVKVSGIENDKGIIQLGLYNSKLAFPDSKKVFKGAKMKSSKLGVFYIFKNIPIGTYALAIYHDENSDNKLNTNLIGVPKEKYGFSNNKFGMFGPPEFEEVSFSVLKGVEINHSIKLE